MCNEDALVYTLNNSEHCRMKRWVTQNYNISIGVIIMNRISFRNMYVFPFVYVIMFIPPNGIKLGGNDSHKMLITV